MRRTLNLVSLGLVLAAGSSALAQPCPQTVLPSVPTAPGDPCATSTTLNSQCWFGSGALPLGSPPYPENHSIGFTLNVDLTRAPVQGDFMPAELDLARGSLPLLPLGTAAAPTAPGSFARPMLGDLDLITGQQLLTHRDLELPFGGATYRLTRTYALPGWFSFGPMNGAHTSSQVGDNWDWVGLNWMLGEAPLFLIDTAMCDMVGDPTSNSRRCYFIPDAHHAIPFDLIIPSEGQPYYEAPPRFGATLVPTGSMAWDAAQQDWGTRPTGYTLTLGGGAIIYRIRSDYGDLPLNRLYTASPPGPYSTHAVPDLTTPPGVPSADLTTSRGDGRPYLGLVESIEDRFGNQIKINYASAGFSGANMDSTAGCHECVQNCPRKGQIASIQLRIKDSVNPDIEGGDGRRTVWTLIYAYRAGEYYPPPLGSFRYEFETKFPRETYPWMYSLWERQNALLAVYAYEGLLPAAQLAAAPTVPERELLRPGGNFHPDELTYLQFCDQFEAIDWYNALDTGVELDEDWRYSVRYTYEWDSNLPLLAKARTITAEPGTSTKAKRDTLYVNDYTTISWFLTQAEIDRIRRGMEEQNAPNPTNWSENEILTGATTQVWLPGEDGSPPSLQAVESVAPQFVRTWSFTNATPHTQAVKRIVDDATFDIDVAPNGPVQLVDTLEGLTEVYAYRDDHGVQHFCRCYWLIDTPWLDGVSASALQYGGRMLWAPRAPSTGDYPAPTRSIMHLPYRLHAFEFNTDPSAIWNVDSGALAEPRYVAIIDEYPTLAAAQNQAIAEQGPAIGPDQVSRRIVKLNAAGFPLFERTWFLQDGTTTSSGLSVEHEYYDADDHGGLLEGCLKETRTIGWGATPQTDQDEKGLIQVFNYNLNEPEEKYRIIPDATGIKRGTEGTVYWQTQTFRDPDRKDQVICEVQFTEARTQLLTTAPAPGDPPALGMIIRHSLAEYVEPTPPTNDPMDLKLRERRVIGPPATQEPSGPLFYPVSCERYDDRGNLQWKGEGLLRDPEIGPTAPGQAGERFTLHYYHRDPENTFNQTIFSVLDYEAGAFATKYSGGIALPDRATIDIDPAIPTPPWDRISDGDPALIYTTAFVYDYTGALSDMYLPSGRAWKTRTSMPAAGRMVAVFNDLEWRDPDGTGTEPGAWHALSPGEITIYPWETEGESSTKQRVQWTNPVNPENSQWTGTGAYTVLAEGSAERSPSGKPVVISVKEGGATEPEFVLRTAHNDLGEVVREQDIHGGVTRSTRDQLGQVLRVYRGSIDTEWQTQPHPPTGPTFDLALHERRSYGTTSNDIMQLVSSWQYLDKPSFAGSPYSEVPTSNTEGIRTDYGYDWRMRQVRVDRYSEGGSVTPVLLERTLTYLDHLDRPWLVAVFGGSTVIPASVYDPTLLCTEDWDESSEQTTLRSAILAADPRSVTEKIYGTSGKVEEERSYNLESPSATNYLATRRYYGQGGQIVFSQSPGSGIQITKLDGAGRVRSVATCIARPSSTDYEELSRVDSKYDADGNVIETVRWERLHDKEGATYGHVLNDTNAVCTRTFMWYDMKKRVIATADLGTEGAGFVLPTGTPVNRENVQIDPSSVPGFTPPSGLPSEALFTSNEYNENGQLYRVYHPNNTYTEYQYDGLGQMRSMMEGGNSLTSRITNYEYKAGRLVEVRTNRIDTGGSDPGEPQCTFVLYGADIVDRTVESSGRYKKVSLDLSAVRGVIFPRDPPPTDPEAVTDPDLIFTYFTDGSIAERIDKRDVVLRHSYDSLRRISRIDILYPSSMTPPSGAPADRATFIEYAYDSRGQLEFVTSYLSAGKPISQVKLVYDNRGNLRKEYQSHGALVDSSTPYIDYTRDYASTGATPELGGFDRLATMTYPIPYSGSSYRTITLNYGSAGDYDHVLSRIREITASGIGNIGAFKFAGTDRRVRFSLDVDHIVQSFRTGTEHGYAGLDSFGRTGSLFYRNQSSQVLFGAEYTWDKMGNRITAVPTYHSTTGPISNERSQLNAYDDLNRLINYKLGALSWSTAQPPVPSIGTSTPYSVVRETTWFLDNLDNWTGNTTTPGRRISADFNSDNVADTKDIIQTPDIGNRIASRTSATNLSGGSPTSSTATYIYDAAGSLVSDGLYFYQYDASNRLLQINQINAAAPMTFNADGTVPSSSAPPGPLVKHYTYDALGRLIRAVSPFPEPGASTHLTRTEAYYYDGLRRIQEVRTDPVFSLEDDSAASAMNLESEQQELLGAGTDGETVPVGYENQQKGAGTNIQTWLDREYVWGPTAIDELLCQIVSNKPWWVLLDDGGDAVSVCERPSSPIGAVSRVVHQRSYDPYGEALHTEGFYIASPQLRAGHKCLFFDRIDLGVASGGVDTPQIFQGADGIYYNRNRSYKPSLGRFMQRDPNATGAPLHAERAFHGRSASVSRPPLDLLEVYGDGANLYAYLGSNSFSRSDPLGLFFGDPASFAPEDLLDLAPVGVEMYARTGILAARIARDLLSGYAGNMMADVEWAQDWSYDDDSHSRLDSSWVNEVYGIHLQDFFDTLDPTTGLIVADRRGNGGGGSRGRRGLKAGGGGGDWVPSRASMSDRARAFQDAYSGKPGFDYKVIPEGGGRGVLFDGFKGGAHVECKGPGYHEILTKDGRDFRVSQAGPKLQAQAQRQRKAIGSKARLHWYVHAPAAEAVRKHAIRGDPAIIIIPVD